MSEHHQPPVSTASSPDASPRRIEVDLPAPTVWPFVMALGITLICASLVTYFSIGVLGLVLFLVAGVGWFRQILPHERHEKFTLLVKRSEVTPARRRVARIQMDETHRAQLP